MVDVKAGQLCWESVARLSGRQRRYNHQTIFHSAYFALAIKCSVVYETKVNCCTEEDNENWRLSSLVRAVSGPE